QIARKGLAYREKVYRGRSCCGVFIDSEKQTFGRAASGVRRRWNGGRVNHRGVIEPEDGSEIGRATGGAKKDIVTVSGSGGGNGNRRPKAVKVVREEDLGKGRGAQGEHRRSEGEVFRKKRQSLFHTPESCYSKAKAPQTWFWF